MAYIDRVCRFHHHLLWCNKTWHWPTQVWLTRRNSRAHILWPIFGWPLYRVDRSCWKFETICRVHLLKYKIKFIFKKPLSCVKSNGIMPVITFIINLLKEGKYVSQTFVKCENGDHAENITANGGYLKYRTQNILQIMFFILNYKKRARNQIWPKCEKYINADCGVQYNLRSDDIVWRSAKI